MGVHVIPTIVRYFGRGGIPRHLPPGLEVRWTWYEEEVGTMTNSAESRWLGGKLSRRALVRGIALGMATPIVGGLLAACGQQATPTPAPQPTPTVAPAQQATPTAAAAATPAPAATPVVLKGTKLNILFGTFFVPETQDLMKQQLQEFGKETGVEATIDFINWPDLQPKISAAVQAGAGPDIVGMWDTWPSLYKEALVDVQDIVEQRIKGEGDYFDWVKKTVLVGDQWLSIPIGAPTSAQVFRKSALQQAGWPDPNNPRIRGKIFSRLAWR